MSLVAFDKDVTLRGQVSLMRLFRFCCTLSDSSKGKKYMVWFYTFFTRRNQNLLNDMFKVKSLSILKNRDMNR